MMQRLISGLILPADVISGFIATPGLNTRCLQHWATGNFEDRGGIWKTSEK
jgi:hypothetical protein